jgi:hypothetical protein
LVESAFTYSEQELGRISNVKFFSARCVKVRGYRVAAITPPRSKPVAKALS